MRNTPWPHTRVFPRGPWFADPIIDEGGGGPVDPPPTDPLMLTSWFGAEEGGAWFRPGMSNCFQDTAGTVPVTADGQRVALWSDATGNGHHFIQETESLRPYWRENGGIPYLDFTGEEWMVGNSAGVFGFPNLVLTIIVQMKDTLGGSLLMMPQNDTTHAAPYMRLGHFKGGGNHDFGESRVNGDSTEWTATGILVAPGSVTIDAAAGKIFWKGAEVSTFTPAAITYPNSVRIRLGSNGAGTERPNMRCYGVAIRDTTLGDGQIAALLDWEDEVLTLPPVEPTEDDLVFSGSYTPPDGNDVDLIFQT